MTSVSPDEYESVSCGFDGKCQFTFEESTDSLTWILICTGFATFFLFGGLGYYCGLKKGDSKGVSLTNIAHTGYED
jgi:hypothetical protein